MKFSTSDMGFALLYTSSMVAEAYVEYYNYKEARNYIKPSVIAILIVYFSIKLKGIQSNFKQLMRIALILCLVGDISLLFEEKNELFFILGLGSFLIAHALYAVGFVSNEGNKVHKHKKTQLESTKLNAFILTGVFPFYALSTSFYLYIRDDLGDLSVPVVIYIIVLASMGVASVFRAFFTNRKSFLLGLFGAIIFMVSDVAMALQKFKGVHMREMPIIINSTYFVAQYLIASATIEHLMQGNVASKTQVKNKKKKDH